MHYEIYMDVVFLTNLLMDYILLRVTGMIFRCRKSRMRTLLGAVLGAAFSCLSLFIRSEIFLPAFILLHGGCAVGMLVVGCGLKKGSLLLKAVLTLYLAAFLCGGIWEAADGRNLSLQTFVLLGTGTWLLLTAWFYLAQSLKTQMRNIYPVTLSHRGKNYTYYGFYDSGNLLVDPVNRKPVSVGKQEILYEMLPQETAEQLKHLRENPGELYDREIRGLQPRLIPFQSIGKGQGMILAVTLEKLCIQTPAEVVQIENPVIAFDFQTSAFGKEYEILLNSRLL